MSALEPRSTTPNGLTDREVIQSQVLASACQKQDGQGGFEAVKLCGSHGLQTAHSDIARAPSHQDLNARVAAQAQHLNALRLLRALTVSGAESNPEALRKVSQNVGDQIKKIAQESDAIKDAIKSNGDLIKSARSFDSYTCNSKLFSKKLGMESPGVNTFCQGMARALIRVGKKLSSIGDMVNAVTTVVINSFRNLIREILDNDSWCHISIRALFCWPALIIMGGSCLAIQAMIKAIPGGESTKLFGRALTDFVGWYWWLAPTHFAGGLCQFAGSKMRNTKAHLSDKQIRFIAQDSLKAFRNLAVLVQACPIDGQEGWRAPLMECLKKVVDKETAEAVLDKLAEATGSVNDEVTLEQAVASKVAELFSEAAKAKDSNTKVFKYEKALLSLMWKATDQTAAASLDQNHNAKSYVESQARASHYALNKSLSDYFYRQSKGRECGGLGYYKTMYKAAEYFRKQASPSYCNRSYQRLKETPTEVARHDPAYMHHLRVLRDDPRRSCVTRTLAKAGLGLRDFARVHVLCIDTNTARALRHRFIKAYEKHYHEHGSVMGAQTMGMLVGWFTVGFALNALSMLGGFGFIPFVGNAMGAAAIGAFSLTMWYFLTTSAAAGLMGLAKASAKLEDMAGRVFQ